MTTEQEALERVGEFTNDLLAFRPEGLVRMDGRTTTATDLAALPALPRPAVTFADHSYPAYSKAQMEAYARQTAGGLLDEVERLREALGRIASNGFGHKLRALENQEGIG